jgi:hypothetical protein
MDVLDYSSVKHTKARENDYVCYTQTPILAVTFCKIDYVKGPYSFIKAIAILLLIDAFWGRYF